MLHACIRRFDVMSTVGKKNLGTKLGLINIKKNDRSDEVRLRAKWVIYKP